MYKSNLKKLKKFRKKLRNSSTSAEAVLWEFLKNKQLEQRKFRRQHSINCFILDFYCPTEKLAIELDGEIHNFEKVYKKDLYKEVYLNNLGIKIIRFENKAIFENIELY